MIPKKSCGICLRRVIQLNKLNGEMIPRSVYLIEGFTKI